jgi:hypothetical protein
MAASWALSLGACASLSGLDDGAGPTDAAHADTHRADVTRPVDAREAGATDAGVDAPLDGSVDSADASVPPDADAAADVGCVPVIPPEAGPQPASTCSAPAGGACAPQAIPMFSPVQHPPRVVHGACTAAQIDQIVEACFGEDMSSCSSLIFNSANTTCYECMVTSAGSASYGPVINGGEVQGLALNTAGCLQLVDPCQGPCAAIAAAEEECEAASCGGACTAEDFDQCSTLATQCTCAAYENAYEDCYAGGLAKNPAVSSCISANTDTVTLTKTYVTLFCGALDGG